MLDADRFARSVLRWLWHAVSAYSAIQTNDASTEMHSATARDRRYTRNGVTRPREPVAKSFWMLLGSVFRNALP